MRTNGEFAAALRQRLRDAASSGAEHLEVNAGQLHRDRGGYPAPNHQMTGCCGALHEARRAGDTIRYKLPR